MQSLNNTDTDKDLNAVFSQDVINALVGAENINAYSFALRLTPFEKLDHATFKKYGEQALESIHFWMTDVETPFTTIYSSIETAIFHKQANETIDDFLKAIQNYSDNPSDNNKTEVIEPIDYYIDDFLTPTIEKITKVNDKINCFRERLAEDSKHFQEISQALPSLTKANEDDVATKTDQLHKNEQKILDLGEDIRKKKLAVRDKSEEIRKAGICCAVPVINFFAGIAMAVLVSDKAKLEAQRDELEEKLEKTKENSEKITSELIKLNKQMPILTTMSTQVPSLYTLSLKSADVAQSIKRNWDEISNDLGTIKTGLGDINDKGKSNYALKKIKARLLTDRNNLQTTIQQFKHSNSLGVVFDPVAEQAFQNKIKNFKSIDLKHSPRGSSLYCIPTQELYAIILKTVNK